MAARLCVASPSRERSRATLPRMRTPRPANAHPSPGHPNASRLRSVSRRGALLALALGLPAIALGAACGGGGSSYRPRERVPTVPLRQSDRERSNAITYYLASITQKGPVVLVDLDLMNGHSRGFSFITVWITLIGTQGEKQQISHAIGQVGPHEQHHVIARAKNVVFEVASIEVGAQIR